MANKKVLGIKNGYLDSKFVSYNQIPLNQILNNRGFGEYQLSNNFDLPSNTYVNLPFNKVINTSPLITLNYNNFIVNSDCLILINCGLQISNLETHHLFLYKNDEQIKAVNEFGSNTIQGTFLLNAKSGDKVELKFFCGIDSTILNNNFSFLQVVIIF